MKITLDGVFGFKWGIERTRLSYNRGSDALAHEIVLDGKDIELAKKLIKRGPEHAKFLRCVTVYMTVQASRGWWQQADTYRVGVQAMLSESTMHTILKRPLTQNDFDRPINEQHLQFLNQKIAEKDFGTVKNNLPEGFLQTRGICLNYQTLRTIYHQRKNHRLPEWTVFCQWVETLPYSDFLTVETGDERDTKS